MSAPTEPTPAELTARAAAYWTKEQTAKVTGGRAYPILPGPGAVLLRALGLLNRDATMSADAVRKYGQVNHLVTLLEPSITALAAAFPTVRVLDAGCGSSYLTYVLAWCFAHRWKHAVEILGVDGNAKVIAKCRERVAGTGLEASLRFEVAQLGAFDWAAAYGRQFGAAGGAGAAGAGETPRPNAVVALHACDTATDDALALAVGQRADFIAAAPCCQAELARKWSQLAGAHTRGAFAPIWNAPQLRRDAAATMTDTLRMLLLRGCGYEVTPQEFVPSAHTPKNTLLRATRRGNYQREALREYVDLVAASGGQGIALAALLPAEHRERLAATLSGAR